LDATDVVIATDSAEIADVVALTAVPAARALRIHSECRLIAQPRRLRGSVVTVAGHLRLIARWSDVRGVNTRRTHLAIHFLPNDVGTRGMKAPTNWHWVMRHEGAPVCP
jgi:hypothetical protein